MSLSSILSSYGFTGSSTSGSASQAAAAAAKQVVAELETVASTSTDKASGTTGGAASISAAAQAALDNTKDFSALTNEVRQTLDEQYATGTAKGSPDLSKLSGRALAAIALNRSGSFSASEVAAAKTALRSQTQSEFVTAMGSGQSGLATYAAQAATEYDGMSPEERQARGWTAQFRTNIGAVTASSGGLFAQLG